MYLIGHDVKEREGKQGQCKIGLFEDLIAVTVYNENVEYAV